MPSKPKYAQRSPGTLREFSTSYDAPLYDVDENGSAVLDANGNPKQKLDTRGRPLTEPRYVVIHKDDHEGALGELARQLRSRETISGALRDWLAYAIEHRSEFPSLDHALGLRAMPGAKRQPATKDDLMRGVLIFRLLELLQLPFTWEEIAEVLSAPDGNGPDESSLREFYSRVSPDLVKDGFALRVPGASTGISQAEWTAYYSAYKQAVESIQRRKKERKKPTRKAFRG